MFFVNQRFRALPNEPNTPEVLAAVPPDLEVKVRDVFLEHADLIESFVADNPFHLPADELAIVHSWRHLVAGKFYIFRELQKYTVFLSSEKQPVAYGVVALSLPFEELIGPRLPVLTKTVLLPEILTLKPFNRIVRENVNFFVVPGKLADYNCQTSGRFPSTKVTGSW
jgi:hypothetical protein